MTGAARKDMIDTVERSDVLLADRAYDSKALRQTLAARGATANVKPMPNRIVVLRFSRWLYCKRNLVERFFNKIKHYRRVKDYERCALTLADIYLAFVCLTLKNVAKLAAGS